METDHQTLETTSDQVGTSDDHEQGSSPARSYECTFCKRGFSTAQALGGHMNIHRKDKAKLRKASSEPLQHYSLDISKPAPLFSPIPTNTKDLSQLPVYTTSTDHHHHQERSKIGWPNWIVSSEDDDHDATMIRPQALVGQPQGLSFFSDHRMPPPSSTRDRIGTENPEKSLSPDQHGSSGSAPELDLELRLGPEPPHGSSKATGTKKFF